MTGKIKVSLMGGTGYAAAELIRRLINHPRVELARVASIDHVGENVGLVHRSFGDRLGLTFENLTPEEVAKDCEVVFLALPHKVSFQKAPDFLKLGVRVVDFSGDYRLRDPKKYEKYYGCVHSNPENLSQFVYGLPELNREKLRETRHVANPGCFATAVALGLLPLAKNGLLEGKVRIVAATGSTGAGVAPQEGTHHPVRSLNMKSYKVLGHQHQPEMEQTLADAGARNLAIDFIPISAPLSRGMLINSIVDLPPSVTKESVERMYSDYYRNEPFVRLLGPKSPPEVVAVAGSNYCDIGWKLDEERFGTKSFAVMSALDNLVKGAAGQAVQNMNVMMGFEETAALSDFGVWP